MVAMNPLLNQTCRQLLDAFFAKFPNEQLRGDSGGVLLRLLARKVPGGGRRGGRRG